MNTKQIKDFLSLAALVTPKGKCTMPILKHVAIGYDADLNVKIQATNLDQWLNFGSRAPFKQALTVDLKVLSSLVKIIKNEQMNYKIEGSRLFIEGSVLPGVEIDQWPVCLEILGKLKSFTPAAQSAIQRVIKAASTDCTRYNLQGVFFETIQEGSRESRVSGTNGHWLACEDIRLDLSGSSFIVPTAAINVLPKLKPCGFYHDDKHVCFEADHTLFISKKIDAEFPNYKMILPDHAPSLTLTDLSVPETQAALSRLEAIHTDKNKCTRLDITNRIKFSASSPERGEAEYSFNSFTRSGKDQDLSIGYNGNYLRMITEIMQSKVMRMDLYGNQGVTLFKDPGNEALTVALMPMRLL